MLCRGPGKWREFRVGTQVVPLYMPDDPKARPPSSHTSYMQQAPLHEALFRVSKVLTAQNQMAKLTDGITQLVKEPDSPGGRIQETRFRLVMEEAVRQVLSREEFEATFPAKKEEFKGAKRGSTIADPQLQRSG
eukprot:TRINITY_DN55650_c0_g1_i1.p1 TRINITY_DN55650_c0_g1~~TRINITY_DN55650_c0_g1_i1.p1  ORF type:complete len:134 (-),score=38.59 TRINITY_DN55650_c0_g1_i1:7-408(-)